MKKLIISAFAVFMLCLSVNAATVAYWRLEEGPNGSTHTTDMDGYFTDTSGNGNNMSTWYRPAGISDVPFATVPQTSVTNEAAFNFLRNKNMYVGTYDNNKPIESYMFTNGWTIELSFKHHYQHKEWERLFGKDDVLTPVDQQPFYFICKYLGGEVWEDGKIEMGVVDDAGNWQFILSQNPYEKEEWISLAATFDPVSSNMNLYLKGENDANYALQGTVGNIPGVSLSCWGTSSWTIAVGMHWGLTLDPANSSIDEVRICDGPLAVNQFLGSTGGAAVSPLAYWRFEEGTNGVHNADMDNYYKDSSGNGNHMSTPVLNQARSIATNDVPFANVPQTGATDTMARCILGYTGAGGLQNIGTFGYESSPKSVESDNFDSGFTVECMAKTDVTTWQTIVGKNGACAIPHNGWWNQNFRIQFQDVCCQKIECCFFDDNTNFVSLVTTWNYNVGEWYRIAVTCPGGTQALLYVAQEGESTYDLEASTITAYNPITDTHVPMSGGIIDQTRAWTLGHGNWGGLAESAIQGNVDEVRISDTALLPSQFLGAVPEPGMILGGIVLALFAFRRK